MQKKIIFVCAGNMCRSPMAEYLFREMLKKEITGGACMADMYKIESRGTLPFTSRRPMYIGAWDVMMDHGIDCYERRAAMFRAEDYDDSSLILCMDIDNAEDIRTIAGGDPENKIHLLNEYAGVSGSKEIHDPMYTQQRKEDFEKTYQEIYTACELLKKRLATGLQ